MNRTWSIDVQWSSVYNWHINNTLVFLMIYAITGVVNGENTELGGSVSKERIQDKITKVKDSCKVFLICTLNAEGKEGEKMMTGVKMTQTALIRI